MATCSFHHIKIGSVTLKIDDNKAVTDNPDSLLGYSVTDCSLTKELLKPNEFTFTLCHKIRTKDNHAKQFSIVKDLMGKKVECKVDVNLSGGTTSSVEFKGVIGKVFVKGMDATCMMDLSIVCVAYSNEFVLQGPPKSRCFINKKLAEVVDAIVPNDIVKSVDIQPVFKSFKFPFIVQYNESDYDFLIRLAKRFGVFLYHDQTSLIFGKVPDMPGGTPKKIDPKYAIMTSYELQSGNPNTRFITHQYEIDKDLDSQGNSFAVLAPIALSEMTVNASTEFKGNSPYRIDDPNSLPDTPTETFSDEYGLAKIISDLSSMVTCKFVTYLFDLEVGNVITINDNGPMVVTSVHLTWDCNGSPRNEVTAMVLANEHCPSDSIFAPYFDFNAYPKSSAQRAVVLNNVDEKNMGRVQVQFLWQVSSPDDDKKNFPWIRIAQPYGGNNKGCYILPEIGEEVMVGFEHENMEKPFVIGTLYHDADPPQEGQPDRKQMPDKAWVETKSQPGPPAQNATNQENEVKAFRTKKGHTIEFHDVKDQCGFIRIYNSTKDNKYYDIILSSDQIQVPNAQNNGKEDYKTSGPKADGIKAANDIEDNTEYTAANLRLMVRSYGGDIVLDAGEGDIIMNAKNIRVHATGDVTSLIDQKNIVKVKGGQFADVSSNSLVVQGKQDILVKGEDTESYQQKVNIQADEAVSLHAKKNVDAQIDDTASLKGKKTLDVQLDDAVKFTAKSLASETTAKTQLKASDIDAEASGSAKIKAASIAVEANKNVDVTANTGLDLDGGTEASIKGQTTKVGGGQTTKVGGLDVTVGEVSTTIKGKAVVIDVLTGTRKGQWTDM